MPTMTVPVLPTRTQPLRSSTTPAVTYALTKMVASFTNIPESPTTITTMDMSDGRLEQSSVEIGLIVGLVVGEVLGIVLLSAVAAGFIWLCCIWP